VLELGVGFWIRIRVRVRVRDTCTECLGTKRLWYEMSGMESPRTIRRPKVAVYRNCHFLVSSCYYSCTLLSELICSSA